MSLMQVLYWFAFISLLAFSWSRSRGILHPHFMFCVMLFILASDFMIRGMEDQNLQWIMKEDLTRYQLATLVTLIGIGITTSVVRRPYEAGIAIVRPEMSVTASTARYLLLISIAVVLIHTGFRLNAVGWSGHDLLDQMFGPRDTRLWDQVGDDGTRNPVYQLFNGMIPLTAIAFAFVLFSRHTGSALAAAAFLGLSLFILVTDGSRTQAIIPMASLAIFGLMSLRSFVAKATLLVGVVGLIALATSAMYLFRAQGIENSANSFALTYHQDDSIYRIWSACAFADFSNYRWDPLYFFYYVISLPFPRTLWPGKPLLTEDFYGGFKLWYTTTTFIGEWVAMLGVWLGFVAAFVFGNLLYRAFYLSQKLLNLPFGLPAYLLVALYTYMVMRSMPNMSMFIFAPAAALILVYIARRRRVGGNSQAGTGGSPAWSN